MTSRPWTFRAAAIGVALAAATATCSAFTTAQADTAYAAGSPSAVDRQDPASHNHVEHDLEGPLSKTQAAQREEALNQVLSGKATVKNRGGSKVVGLKSKKGDTKYVELGREKTDKIFTILVEFGDKVDSRYGGTPGPLHNQIAKPDRKVDNSTAWQEDYDQQHFQDLYFGSGKGVDSVKTYYEKQSSGRYSVDGEVSDWVKVPYNEARYGSNYCGDTNCSSVWNVVSDGLNAWVEQQKAAAAPTPRSRPTWPATTSGTATTSTATATSTSPTATSTTSRSCTPVRTSPAGTAASRARTRSGPTAGTPSAPTPAPPAPSTTSSAARRSATPASGSATTPSSRRTADSASSPTSTATTSVCRTSTTPRAARTPPASGR